MHPIVNFAGKVKGVNLTNKPGAPSERAYWVEWDWDGFGFERFFGDGSWRLHLHTPAATSDGRQDLGRWNVHSGRFGQIHHRGQ